MSVNGKMVLGEKVEILKTEILAPVSTSTMILLASIDSILMSARPTTNEPAR